MPAIQASLTIDLDALAANYAATRRQAAGGQIAPVVKADAYGLGLGPVARRLRAEGAQRFFVARLSEGIALRLILGRGPVIYVLDGCPPGAASALMQAELTPVLNSLEQIADWTHADGGGAALHIDTGLNRLGLRPQEAEALNRQPTAMSGLNVSLVMSHLACGSSRGHPMNQTQAAAFAQVRTVFPDAEASLANSGGLFQNSAFALDLARPGIVLYGGGPFDEPDPRLAPVVTLEAPILQIRIVPAGESIGYDIDYVAPQSLSVALVAAGYADGVLRAGNTGGYGWLHGAQRRMLGWISMDLIAIDVSDCPTARPGDMVQLLGPQVPIDDLAKTRKTIAYEILTRLSGRANRSYLAAGA